MHGSVTRSRKMNKSFTSNIASILEPILFAKPYFKKGMKYFVLVIVAGIAANLFRLLVPLYIGNAVSALETAEYGKVLYFAEFIVIFSSISAGVQFIVNYGSQYISQSYAYYLRKDLVAHLVRKKFHFFENQTSGDLLSRGTMDIQATRYFLLNLFSIMFPTIFLIIEAFILLFFISPYFSLLLVVSIPALILLGMRASRKQRPLWRRIRAIYGRIGEVLQENIVGQRVIRGLSARKEEIGKFEKTTDEYLEQNFEVGKIRGLYNNLMPIVVAAAATTVIAFGGYIDLINKFSVGGLVAAVNILTMITFPASFMGRMIVFSENARAAITRIKEITESGEEEIVDSSEYSFSSGPLSFNHVSFKRAERPIFEDVSFRIQPNEFVGITGKTGVGKTTLVNLITRYYDPDKGDIKVGETNINDIPLSILRSRISIVPQEITLLSGTIEENILFGLDADESKMKEAARIASISDFIESLPQKYRTAVGERGITLSGGQRQRIAIARAVLRKPHILILDDATSSVDPDTEIRIFKNLIELLKDTIIIMITLRPSALSFAKKVLILERGELREDLSGEDLLNVK